MDKFINIFVDIDFDNSGAITVASLEHFCATNRLDKCMIDTWVTLFDNQHTGKITQKKFCEVLGLAPEQIDEARSRRSSLASTGQLTPKDAPSSRRTSAVVLDRLEEVAKVETPKSSRRASSVVLQRPDELTPEKTETKGSRRTSAVVLEKPQESTPKEVSRRISAAPSEKLIGTASVDVSRRTSVAPSEKAASTEILRRSSAATTEQADESEPDEMKIEVLAGIPIVCSQPFGEYDDYEEKESSRRSSAAALELSQEPTPEELSRRSSYATSEQLEENNSEATGIVLLQQGSKVCSAPTKQLGKDVEVISAKMSLEDQILLSDETRAKVSQLKDKEGLGKLSREMKAFAEQNFGEYWQVLIVRGDFWATFSHLPESSFQFHMNGRSYLFWKTS